ncbi:MAG: hypothetical protein JNL67_20470 [Planctomycetaceae bacterium]|nr:hypothetical protein [Planctomycetaceae bacterium]
MRSNGISDSQRAAISGSGFLQPCSIAWRASRPKFVSSRLAASRSKYLGLPSWRTNSLAKNSISDGVFSCSADRAGTADSHTTTASKHGINDFMELP